jgi:hypothetical protein
MNGNQSINPEEIDIFDAVETASLLVNVKTNSINDLPRLAEALEAWNQFEAANGTKNWYEYLRIRINEEMNVRNAETA